MNAHLARLDVLARQAGLTGLPDLQLAGRFTGDGAWHQTDCKIVGPSSDTTGPYPAAMVAGSMLADCCQPDIWGLIDEISPMSTAHVFRALVTIEDALAHLELLRNDRSATPFADLVAVDAAVDFASELDELAGNVAHRLVRASHSPLITSVREQHRRFDEALTALRAHWYGDSLFLDELFTTVQDKLGVEYDDTSVLVSCSAFGVHHPDNADHSYLLQAMTQVFAEDAVSSRCIARMPRWAYRTLRQLGGRDWLSSAHTSLSASVEETARALWVHEPTSPMYDFDTCVQAAIELCREPGDHRTVNQNIPVPR